MTLRHRLHRVLYVPLDDRPYNLKAPRLLAQMVDYEMLTPPVELLGRFRVPGQPEEIAAWVRAHAEAGLDCIILSLDMLAYGGLWASRAATTRTRLAHERLGILRELRDACPETTIYAFSVLLRLGTVTGSDEAAMHLAALARHSMLSDAPTDAGDPKLNAERAALERRIPAPVLGEYLAVRARNHEINLRAVAELAEGNADFVAFAQDSSAERGVHRREQEALQAALDERGVADRALILPGADQIAMCLLARFVHKHMDKTPLVRIITPADADPGRIPPGEDRPWEETLRLHLQLVGAEEADAATRTPDMLLAVNAPAPYEREDLHDPALSRAHRERARQLLSRATRAADGRGLAACDIAFPNGADDIFVREMIAATPDLPGLLAYAGWNTAANSIGSALAQGALRLIALQDKGAFDLARLLGDMSPMRYLSLLDSVISSEQAHIRLLMTRLTDDWLYQARVRPRLTDHICTGLRTGIFDLSRSYHQAESMMRDELTQAVSDLWIDQFLGRRCVSIGSDLPEDEQSALVLAELQETRLSLPWRRLFEIDVELEFDVQLIADRRELQ